MIFLGIIKLLAMQALNTAATGMKAQEENVNVISNNIANINTTGFKKGRANFNDLFYQTLEEAGSSNGDTAVKNTGIQIGMGVKVTAVSKEFSQGAPNITKNPFDLMINGEGFFGILVNEEIRYTRDGRFSPDRNGDLVSSDGYQLYPGFNIPLNTTNVNIDNLGNVEIFQPGELEAVGLGNIPVFTFINPSGLRSLGGDLYSATRSSGEAVENIAGENNAGVIMQGALEYSNVNIMTEMTDLIRAQRAYEMNSKVMQVADQMMQTVNGVVR